MRNLAIFAVTSLACAALMGSVGCKKSTGNVDTGGGGGGGDSDASIGARDYFITKVYPVVSKTCGECHAGTGAASTFLTTTPEQSYQLISSQIGYIADPAKSPLVQHVHSDKTIVLTPEQRAVLTQWLNLEATARGLAGSIDKPPTLQAAYKQFADCMNFDVWEYYRVGDMPFVQTDYDGPCMGCHSIGQGSNWLSAGSRESFEKAKEFPYIQKWVVGKVDADGNFDSLIPANRFSEKSNEVCTNDDKAQCHPTFGLPPNVQRGVDLFIQTTLQNVAAGTCGVFIPTKDAGPADAADGGGK